MVTGRFAPSPSGRMHLGNAFAALMAWLDVRAAGGRLMLRIEDLDPDRCRPEYAAQLLDDLNWLGLDWDEGPYYQSQRTKCYEAAFADLRAKNLLYPCFCTRSDRLAAAAPHPGEETQGAKPCPCKGLSQKEREARALTKTPAWKIAVSNETVSFVDGLFGPQSEVLAQGCGDFVVRRADGVFAYQLAVTVDDGEMGVNRVVRGRDLLGSTPRQIWLMTLLGHPAPSYCHVPLLVAPDGRRLSKREGDLDFAALRARLRPEEVVGKMAFLSGIQNNQCPISAESLHSGLSCVLISKTDIILEKTSF